MINRHPKRPMLEPCIQTLELQTKNHVISYSHVNARMHVLQAIALSNLCARRALNHNGCILRRSINIDSIPAIPVRRSVEKFNPRY